MTSYFGYKPYGPPPDERRCQENIKWTNRQGRPRQERCGQSRWRESDEFCYVHDPAMADRRRSKKPEQSFEWPRAIDVPLRDFDIAWMPLSYRAINCVKRSHIHNLQELLQTKEKVLLRKRNLGQGTLDEIKKALTTKGLGLAGSESTPFLSQTTEGWWVPV